MSRVRNIYFTLDRYFSKSLIERTREPKMCLIFKKMFIVVGIVHVIFTKKGTLGRSVNEILSYFCTYKSRYCNYLCFIK